jgi:CRISPR/Cas system-associated exonuclease Cas4 (RecB family)
MSAMNVQQAVYQALQATYANDPTVNIEDFLDIGCGVRHHLRLSGVERRRPEPAPELLLREAGHDIRNKVKGYLRGCFKKRYSEGYDLALGSVTCRVDGAIDDALVEIALVSTSVYEEASPPRRALLGAITKAVAAGFDKALLIVMDRDKQDWTWWSLAGDFSSADQVLEDVVYVNKLMSEDAIPTGVASERTCRRCPYAHACPVRPTGRDPDPYTVKGVTWTKATDHFLVMEGYLWGLNKKSTGRSTHCIHPSEISTTSCDRVIAYGLMGTKEKRSVDPKLRRIFDVGHAFHDVLQAVMADALPNFRDEVPVYHEGLNIKGHCDGVTKPEDSADLALELKSIGSNGYAKLTSPKSDHKKQATIYAVILDIDDIVYVYACKETGELAVFHVPVDRGVWHASAKRAEDITAQVQRGELPEGIDSDYTCGRCKYAWTCKPQVLRRSGFNDPEQRKLRRFR